MAVTAAAVKAAMAQREIALDGELLTPDGRLHQPGWARGARLSYEPSRVRAARGRIKEWEHYTVLTDEVALSLTLVHLGRIGAAHVELMRLSDGRSWSGLDLFLASRRGLPATPYPATPFRKHTRRTCFEVTPDARSVDFRFTRPVELAGRLALAAPGPEQGLAVATPFARDGLFFYEYKVPDLKPAGWVEAATTRYSLERGHAILDWGRGAWPRRSRWLWAWGSGDRRGRRVSFNLGWGFGDMRAASENAVVVDGVLHKLGRVRLHGDADGPRVFEDDAGRLHLRFTPARHQRFHARVLHWGADLDKAFGRYDGEVTLDDGSVLAVEGLAGFCEEMEQRW